LEAQPFPFLTLSLKGFEVLLRDRESDLTKVTLNTRGGEVVPGSISFLGSTPWTLVITPFTYPNQVMGRMW
tara:strand:- start:1052 stop:1264 length:213 start_codon:yes stop_codon:yes gene_type:complete